MKTFEGSGSGGEFVGFEPEVLEVGDEEVGEGWSFFGGEGEVLAVFEVSTGGDDGEVAVVVAGGVSEVGAGEDGGLIEEGVVAFFDLVEAGHEFGEEAHFLEFDEGEFFDLLFVAAVMAEVVPVFIDSFQSGDVVAAGAAEGDEAGGIGAEGEEDEVIHELHIADEIGAVFDIARGLSVDGGFGELGPFFLNDEAFFKFANTGEVLVEGLVVFATELAGDVVGLLTDEIHNTLAVFDLAHAGRFLFGVAIEEESGEETGGPGLGRDADAGAGVGEPGVVGGEGEGRDAGEVADAFGGELVERDGVFKAGLAGMGGSGEVAFFGGVAAIDIGVHEPGDDGEFFAVSLERFEVGGDFVVAA
jgi:hypothetical protein